MTARFSGGEKYGSRTLATMRQGVGGFTLGNPYSALRQFGDIPVVAVKHGIVNTLRSIPEATLNTIRGQLGIKSKTGISADDFGLMLEMAQELDTGGVASNMIKRASNTLYKYGGFKTVDRLGKNVLMTTALRKQQRMARSFNGKKRLLEEYGNIYQPQEIQQLIKDLSEGKVTDLVKAHVFSELAGIQPISRAQMPKAYLDHPNGRIFYQFRTWGIRQLDMARDEVWRNLLSKDPARKARGARALALFGAYVGAANVGITELQRFLVGRDGKLESADQFPNEVLFATLGNFSFDRYSFEQAMATNKFDAIWQGFAPPAVEIPANAGLSIASALKAETPDERDTHLKNAALNFGLFRLVNYWFFGGAEEANEKQRQQKESEFNKRWGL